MQSGLFAQRVYSPLRLIGRWKASELRARYARGADLEAIFGLI